ncbi:hypothetical protein EV361DRAFT_817349, partial [Lentinula raphanica]
MSDFDDELLELVEADPSKERKRKRSNGSKSKGSHSSKRRKADVSDDEPESEEGEDDPYPLDGKYVDEADMQRLSQLPEVEREDIIATRMEARQKILDKKALALLVKEQRERDRVGDSDGGVAKAAKRQHTARGATKEKMSKLDELKAKRRAKEQNIKYQPYSPKRERSSSPMDMGTSDEDEDGVITKDEQEEERTQRLMNGGTSSVPKKEEPASLQDLERCRLSRRLLLKHHRAPWFPQYVKGMWVRYLLGHEHHEPIYRICQVDHLSDETVKPYKIEDKWFDRQAELVHGSAKKNFNLDQISNASFTEREFGRLCKTMEKEHVPFPTKTSIEVKLAEIERLTSQLLTEKDISSMISKNRELNSQRPPGWTTLERSRLNQARTLALRRQDHAEVAKLDAEIVEFDARYGNANGSNGKSDENNTRSSSGSDVLMKLSEKNRKANAEAVRRAEQQEAERKRRERKLAMNGSGASTPVDPSARLKILPRTLIARTPTPGMSSLLFRSGTPSVPTPSKDAKSGSPLSGSVKSNGRSFEASAMASLEVDLGDF